MAMTMRKFLRGAGYKLAGYSNRLTDGRTCLSTTVDDPKELFLIDRISQTFGHEADELQIDRKGFKYVAYWPTIKFGR